MDIKRKPLGTGILRPGSLGQAAWLALLLSTACGREPAVDSRAVPPAAVNATAGPDGPIASPEPDWPQWRGPRRDGISDEKGLLPSWPEGGPPLLWKVDKLGLGWSSPIIVKDRLYITGDVDDDLLIYAFDLQGKLQWQVKNGESWTGSYPGARACCVYSEGKLYHLNSHGRVVCLEAATGKELWACDLTERFDATEPTWAFAECLLADGPRLIVTPGGKKALMAALDKRDGRTVWTTEPLVGDSTTYSSPLLFRYAGRRILANCSSKHGFGVDADTGRLLWTAPLKSPYGVNVTTPVFGQGRIFYVTAYTGGACYQLRPNGPRIEAERVWSTTLDSCTGAVLLHDGLLYGSGYQKHKSWLCLDWESGRSRYEFKGLTTCSAIYADGRLYCLSADGQASLLKPTPEQLTIAGRFRLVSEKTRQAWAYPVVLHGRLYLRYHDTLWCYDVRSK